MDYSCRSIDYLERTERLRKQEDTASLMYAALELRCGIEARLKEYATNVIGISKTQAREWEITKLGRTLESSYGLGDAMLLIFITLSSGQTGQFLYAPVSAQLRKIGKMAGDYLHVPQPDAASKGEYWNRLSSMLHEGCGLLRLACSGEVLRPSFGDGLHIALETNDPRVQLVQDLQNGAEAQFSVVNITPAGPITYYPADEVSQGIPLK